LFWGEGLGEIHTIWLKCEKSEVSSKYEMPVKAMDIPPISIDEPISEVFPLNLK